MKHIHAFISFHTCQKFSHHIFPSTLARDEQTHTCRKSLSFDDLFVCFWLFVKSKYFFTCLWIAELSYGYENIYIRNTVENEMNEKLFSDSVLKLLYDTTKTFQILFFPISILGKIKKIVSNVFDRMFVWENYPFGK